MSTFILVVFSFLCGFGDKTRFFSGGDYTDVHRDESQLAIGYWLDKDNLGRFTAREHDQRKNCTGHTTLLFLQDSKLYSCLGLGRLLTRLVLTRLSSTLFTSLVV